MPPQLKHSSSLPEQRETILILSKEQAASLPELSAEETAYLQGQLANDAKQVTINRYTHQLHLLIAPDPAKPAAYREGLRKAGAEVQKKIKAAKVKEVSVSDRTGTQAALFVAEGLCLSNYEFLLYKSDTAKASVLETVYVHGDGLEEAAVTELAGVLEAVYRTRDLVNEPPNVLTARVMSERFAEAGKDAGYTTDILDELKIKSLKMGGILAVSQGSVDPPTFSILEWKPQNARNQKPYVLVGKGVVYDTGGLSIKPTPNSMDLMKCDMAGAAAVAGVLYALAKNQVPVHVIALVPACDNRVSGTSFSPGDVITMYSGKTVEVLNTDAEGRLLLADALAFANKYDPELVVDVATLTGAAARAIGKEGIVAMGTASAEVMQQLKAAGEQVYERCVEFPLWEEYGEMIKSDIADIKNIGGPDAGMITAGKFLEHFVEAPWIHLDIAGPAFIGSPDSYRGKQGTGTSVRLLYEFLTNQVFANEKA